jgi:predicted GIY-YIG superfamily endonuclease
VTYEGGNSRPNPLRPYWLYRCLDRNDTLLYVGIARDPARRLREHAGSKSWFGYVAQLDVAAWSWVSREDAEKAEQEAIKTELPLFNRLGASIDQHAAAVEYVRGQGHDSSYYEWCLCSRLTGARLRMSAPQAEIRRMADAQIARMRSSAPDQPERQHP